MSAHVADEPTARHTLQGLEADNVLAFLALLGLLRALEISRPQWRPRAAWSVGSPPLRPVLHLRQAETQANIATAAEEGVAELAKDHDFDRQKLAFSRPDAHSMLSAVAEGTSAREHHRSSLWSALISDVAGRPDADIVERTPLCLLDVAQTAFLKNLREVALPSSYPKDGRKRLTAPEVIQRALFEPWRREHQTASFRWDPIEDSRHAHRWAAPTDEKQGVEHGANVLACLGLRSLTVVPVRSGGNVRLRVRGCRQESSFSILWPIWADPASLLAIESMLASPELQEPGGLAHLGVTEIRKAEKFNPNGGKYSNFGRARVL